MSFLGASEQDYGHTARVCRALPLGDRVQAMAVVLGKRVNTARQAPPVGDLHRVRSQLSTGLKGRPSCVRLESVVAESQSGHSLVQRLPNDNLSRILVP